MVKPQKKKKNVKRKKAKEIELHPDAWERFETGLKELAKNQPLHRNGVSQRKANAKRR
jgi:hypothetical protein